MKNQNSLFSLLIILPIIVLQMIFAPVQLFAAPAKQISISSFQLSPQFSGENYLVWMDDLKEKTALFGGLQEFLLLIDYYGILEGEQAGILLKYYNKLESGKKSQKNEVIKGLKLSQSLTAKEDSTSSVFQFLAQQDKKIAQLTDLRDNVGKKLLDWIHSKEGKDWLVISRSFLNFHEDEVKAYERVMEYLDGTERYDSLIELDKIKEGFEIRNNKKVYTFFLGVSLFKFLNKVREAYETKKVYFPTTGRDRLTNPLRERLREIYPDKSIELEVLIEDKAGFKFDYFVRNQTEETHQGLIIVTPAMVEFIDSNPAEFKAALASSFDEKSEAVRGIISLSDISVLSKLVQRGKPNSVSFMESLNHFTELNDFKLTTSLLSEIGDLSNPEREHFFVFLEYILDHPEKFSVKNISHALSILLLYQKPIKEKYLRLVLSDRNILDMLIRTTSHMVFEVHIYEASPWKEVYEKIPDTSFNQMLGVRDQVKEVFVKFLAALIEQEKKMRQGLGLDAKKPYLLIQALYLYLDELQWYQTEAMDKYRYKSKKRKSARYSYGYNYLTKYLKKTLGIIYMDDYIKSVTEDLFGGKHWRYPIEFKELTERFHSGKNVFTWYRGKRALIKDIKLHGTEKYILKLSISQYKTEKGFIYQDFEIEARSKADKIKLAMDDIAIIQKLDVSIVPKARNKEKTAGDSKEAQYVPVLVAA